MNHIKGHLQDDSYDYSNGNKNMEEGFSTEIVILRGVLRKTPGTI